MPVIRRIGRQFIPVEDVTGDTSVGDAVISAGRSVSAAAGAFAHLAEVEQQLDDRAGIVEARTSATLMADKFDLAFSETARTVVDDPDLFEETFMQRMEQIRADVSSGLNDRFLDAFNADADLLVSKATVSAKNHRNGMVRDGAMAKHETALASLGTRAISTASDADSQAALNEGIRRIEDMQDMGFISKTNAAEQIIAFERDVTSKRAKFVMDRAVEINLSAITANESLDQAGMLKAANLLPPEIRKPVREGINSHWRTRRIIDDAQQTDMFNFASELVRKGESPARAEAAAEAQFGGIAMDSEIITALGKVHSSYVEAQLPPDFGTHFDELMSKIERNPAVLKDMPRATLLRVHGPKLSSGNLSDLIAAQNQLREGGSIPKPIPGTLQPRHTQAFDNMAKGVGLGEQSHNAAKSRYRMRVAAKEAVLRRDSGDPRAVLPDDEMANLAFDTIEQDVSDINLVDNFLALDIEADDVKPHQVPDVVAEIVRRGPEQGARVYESAQAMLTARGQPLDDPLLMRIAVATFLQTEFGIVGGRTHAEELRRQVRP